MFERDLRQHRDWLAERETCGVFVATAAVVVGGKVVSSKIASNASKKATAASTAANDKALAQQQEAQARQQEESKRAETLQDPWRQVGLQALGQLSQVHGIQLAPDLSKQMGMNPGDAGKPYGGFEASPDYAFRRDEGLRAITGNKAAKGLMDSGSLGTGLINYGGAAASQEFGSWYNRLSSLAGVGQTAAQAQAGIIQNGTSANQANVNNQSNITRDQGDNLASGITTRGGINAGLISDLAGTAAGMMNSLPGKASAPPKPVDIFGGGGTYGEGGSVGLFRSIV